MKRGVGGDRGRWGRALLALGAGLLVAIAVFGFVIGVTNDMRWVLGLGSVLLAGGCWRLGRSRRSEFERPVLFCLPLLAVFGAVVLPELPPLWPHLVLWAAFALAGWALAGRMGSSTRRAAPALLAVAALLSLAYAQIWVPDRISERLTRLRDEPAPALAFQTLDGTAVDPREFTDHVLVLAFFATWCQPCIAELPELEALRARLADREDILVRVVANDSGGDTPEAIRAFVEESGTTLPFLYDAEGRTHRAFGFAGLPGLAVVDRHGRLRLTREGFNAAERDFQERLLAVLEEL